MSGQCLCFVTVVLDPQTEENLQTVVDSSFYPSQWSKSFTTIIGLVYNLDQHFIYWALAVCTQPNPIKQHSGYVLYKVHLLPTLPGSLQTTLPLLKSPCTSYLALLRKSWANTLPSLSTCTALSVLSAPRSTSSSETSNIEGRCHCTHTH